VGRWRANISQSLDPGEGGRLRSARYNELAAAVWIVSNSGDSYANGHKLPIRQNGSREPLVNVVEPFYQPCRIGDFSLREEATVAAIPGDGACYVRLPLLCDIDAWFVGYRSPDCGRALRVGTAVAGINLAELAGVKFTYYRPNARK